MKILKRIGIIVGVLIIIFISAGIIISVTYEDTAIKYLKKYLDKHLITEIEVDKINFSLFKNFPNASVELKNIMARSTLNFTASDFGERDTETLLVAENIFFEFKLIKILSGILRTVLPVISFQEILMMTLSPIFLSAKRIIFAALTV